MEWPYKGIVVGDAFAQLGEGIDGTLELQVRKLQHLLEREIKVSGVTKELFERIARERIDDPIELFLGKCSCGFIDSFFNMTMDVDDFDHFPVEPSQKGEDGGYFLFPLFSFLLLSFMHSFLDEILSCVFEETVEQRRQRLMNKGDESYRLSFFFFSVFPSIFSLSSPIVFLV
eukprot:TRINITY_DN2161_c0_g1_i4.p1 TRINITY_DN2161_c0_g1~~TRINITY_DN2161_c0_g1_i4.p1  ORF type:complete len:173 (+),score=31.51 TRINITY_DN2161_c0_g1_i4:355-873(+)